MITDSFTVNVGNMEVMGPIRLNIKNIDFVSVDLSKSNQVKYIFDFAGPVQHFISILTFLRQIRAENIQPRMGTSKTNMICSWPKPIEKPFGLF